MSEAPCVIREAEQCPEIDRRFRPKKKVSLMTACPSREALGRLADAGSTESQYLAMEAHVETCSACQDILEGLAALSSECESFQPKRPPLPEHAPTIPGFVIEREIGRGGMGVVYQAWQPQLDRRVAIKVVAASVLIGAEDRRRWLREARAIGRVRHRNVVRLHEAGERDGCLYLILDLITGGSLEDRVTGPLRARVAAELMAAVAQAVDEIHKAGLLHLDIKPSNILLDGVPGGPWNQVTPLLADFGIARELTSRTPRRPLWPECEARPRSWLRNRLPAVALKSVPNATFMPSGPLCTAS